MADKNLIRNQVGDVSIYKKDPNPSPGVYRSQTAKTIVPSGGDVDMALLGGLPKRVSSFQLMDKHGNEIHHSKREFDPTATQKTTPVAAVRG